jgi:arabinose-5-phosphate isomerase
MITNLLKEQKDNIDYFFSQLSIDQMNALIQKLLICKGSLIISGIGKSGIIANKLAMTLLSTGTKAFYLPCTDALHGDIGIVTKEDICILLSKSGETKELIRLVPYIRKKGAGLVSIVCNEKSQLARLADLFVVLPMKKELCPFNLAPTTSSTIQMIFADVLCAALMRQKNFSLEEYASNHPAGSIGKKISLSVEDIMIKEENIPFCSKEDKVIDVLHDLSSKKCGCMVIVDQAKKLLGIFTDGDLRRTIGNNKDKFLDKKMEDLMTQNPKWISPDQLAWDAMKQMQENGKLVSVMPVVKNNQVVGLIRMHDIVQAGLAE